MGKFERGCAKQCEEECHNFGEGTEWILYCRVRVWVQYLSFAGYHRQSPYQRWLTQFRSIYIYSIYIYILFISKRVLGHYGELISVKIK